MQTCRPERLLGGFDDTRSDFWVDFSSASPGERLYVARASQLGDSRVSTTLGDPFPLRFFASPDPLSHASFSHRLSLLHRRVSTVSSASYLPKIKQASPVVTTIDLSASRMVIGGVGDEQSASIDRSLHGRCCRGCNGRNRRLSGRDGGLEGGRGRRAGRSARAGGPEGGRPAVLTRGRVSGASIVCCCCVL